MNNELRDRAVEWVGVNFPELEGEAYERKVEEVMAELGVLDQEADEGDYLDRCYSDLD